ncbi:Serine palmitoyltransferase [Trichinella spiralis]|uniref:Serine palmitoyltransferase n=1 Tax=Trichinella spiralis TaxID=6334 RepID=A0ABR3K4T7_TRISP
MGEVFLSTSSSSWLCIGVAQKFLRSHGRNKRWRWKSKLSLNFTPAIVNWRFFLFLSYAKNTLFCHDASKELAKLG